MKIMSLLPRIALLAIALALPAAPSVALADPAVPSAAGAPASGRQNPSPERAPGEPMDTTQTLLFIQNRVHANFDAFQNLYICVKEKTAISKSEDSAIWAPEQLQDCEPQLQKFKGAGFRVADLDSMRFVTEQERRSLVEGYSLMSRVHPQMVNYFNYFISQKDGNFTIDTIHAVKNIILWNRKNLQSYRNSIAEIDNLLAQYIAAKGSSVLKSDGSPDNDKVRRLARIRAKLAKFLIYDASHKWMGLQGKGVFIADLDSHTMKFAEKVEYCRRTLDNAANQIKNFQSRLTGANIEGLRAYEKSPSLFNLLCRYPDRMEELTYRLTEMYGLGLAIVNEFKQDKSPTNAMLVALMNMSMLTNETKVLRNFVNKEHSYRKAIRDALVQHLVNETDKNGNLIRLDLREL